MSYKNDLLHKKLAEAKKMILVIEKPNCCEECPISSTVLYEDDINNCEVCVCSVEKKENGYNKKPSWCPLKPMPTKYTSFVEAEDDSDEAIFEEISVNGERRGWNDCIVDILGDTE